MQQPESKKVLVLASLLKPNTDIRMYEKFAKSAESCNFDEIHVIGTEVEKPLEQNEVIKLHNIGSYHKSLASRVAKSARFYQLLVKLKPEVIIITSSDLLIVTALYKIKFGCTLYYDIQENYSLNLWCLKTRWLPTRAVLAAANRFVEICVSRYVDKFFLAERVYAYQLPFVVGKYEIIENLPLASETQEKQPTMASTEQNAHIKTIVYAGTVAKNFGTLQLAKWFANNTELQKTHLLHITGHCPSPALRNQLKQLAANNKVIMLQISPQPIPKQELNLAISNADELALTYPISKSTLLKYPTKYYSFLLNTKPVISNSSSCYFANTLLNMGLLNSAKSSQLFSEYNFAKYLNAKQAT